MVVQEMKKATIKFIHKFKFPNNKPSSSLSLQKSI